MNENKALAWTLLIVLSLTWGSSFILMKLGLVAFSSVEMATLRVVIAAVTLTPYLLLRFRRLKTVSRKQWVAMVAVGVFGNFLPAFLFAEAETVIPSAIAGVLNSLNPLFVLLISFLFFHKRYPLINIIGVLIGVGGAILLITAGRSAEISIDSGEYLLYCLLVIVATFSYAVAANLLKEFLTNLDPIMLTGVALAAVGYPAIALLFGGTDFVQTMETHPGAWSSLGYIAILGSIGTAIAVALFNRLLQISSLVFATSVTYLIPIVALGWGLFFDETLIWQHGLGFAIILSGVYLVNRKK